MAFPTTLDTTSTIPVEAGSTALSVNHVTNHTAMQTAIIALETKLGVDSSAVTTTHDYKLGEVTGTDKAVGKTATQTLTNKTLTSPTVTGATITSSTVNGVTLTTAGSASNFLAENGTYVAGGVSNASTTVKGIVEAATSAEVTAGTATGGTGAVLVVTPDALASSTPVFNGSGLTSTVQGFVGADATNSSAVTSTSVETTVATISIPANTLSTNKILRVRAHFVSGWTGDGNSVTYRFKYGGTTLCSFVIDPTGTPTITMTAIMEAQIQGAGTTSSQECSGTFIQTGETSGATPVVQPSSIATSAIDSTSSQNLIITVQNGGSGSTQTTTLHNYSVQKIV